MAVWRGDCVGPNRTRREGAREHGVTRTRSPLGAKWDLAHSPKVVTAPARLAIYDQLKGSDLARKVARSNV